MTLGVSVSHTGATVPLNGYNVSFENITLVVEKKKNSSGNVIKNQIDYVSNILLGNNSGGGGNDMSTSGYGASGHSNNNNTRTVIKDASGECSVVMVVCVCVV